MGSNSAIGGVGGWQLAFEFKGLLTIFAVFPMDCWLWCAVTASFGGGAAWGGSCSAAARRDGRRCDGAGMGHAVRWATMGRGSGKTAGVRGDGCMGIAAHPLRSFSELSVQHGAWRETVRGGVGVAEKAAAGVFKGWSANYFTGANGRRCLALGCKNIITLTLSAVSA